MNIFFAPKKKKEPIPYFDLSSREKKKLIEYAAKKASEMKRELIARHNKKSADEKV